MNLCKNRKFPSDLYDIDKLNNSEKGKYLGIWMYEEDYEYKGKKYPQNALCTIICVDEDTSLHLYGKKWAKLSFNIMKCYKQQTLWDMKAQIHSIDDSSYGIWWNNKTLEELEDIRTKIINSFNGKPKTKHNGEAFLHRCVIFGADPKTKDYN